MSDITRLRFAVTIGALIAVVAHLVWPHLAVDAVTVALLVVAVIPWLAPLVKSVELPGGFKLELQEITTRADDAGLLAERVTAEDHDYSFQAIADQDPNLALAGLRIEIERRLEQLVDAYGLRSRDRMSVGNLLTALGGAGVLSSEERSVLSDMVHMLNAAVHGADVGQAGAEWAIGVGPRLLASLDDRVQEAVGAQQADPADSGAVRGRLG